jgi:hypothetical protein
MRSALPNWQLKIGDLEVGGLLRGLQLRRELVYRGGVVEIRQIRVTREGVALLAVHKNLYPDNTGNVR